MSMPGHHTVREELLARLDAVERRLDRLVATPTPGLTEPDPATAERWDAGQVWAHIAEFGPYWLDELERVVAAHRESRWETRGQAWIAEARAGSGSAAAAASTRGPIEQAQQVQFGRSRTDPGRVGPIERDRGIDPHELRRRAGDAISRVRAFMGSLPPAEWSATGRHLTRGEMDVAAILDHFVVSHLEEHADQLEGLAER